MEMLIIEIIEGGTVKLSINDEDDIIFRDGDTDIRISDGRKLMQLRFAPSTLWNVLTDRDKQFKKFKKDRNKG
jgi:hypothetical protein